jgi:hypothetical protein
LIFIALKNKLPQPGLNPRTFDPVVSTLTITPPGRFGTEENGRELDGFVVHDTFYLHVREIGYNIIHLSGELFGRHWPACMSAQAINV